MSSSSHSRWTSAPPRPSLRVLYGVQYSNMHDAFGNSFVQTLDQFNQFHETGDRHWHHVVGLEAEAWF